MSNVFWEASNQVRALVELVYPRVCAGCNQHLAAKERIICSMCTVSLPFTKQSLFSNLMADRLIPAVGISGLFSMCYYNKKSIVQYLLHALKYRRRGDVGEALGKILAQELLEASLPPIDLIVPLPLHKKRQAERGYNQAEKIGDGLAGYLGVPLAINAVKRVKYTTSQTNKSRTERLQNVQHAFSAQRKHLNGKRVLLIDDVITTGATIISCSEAILAAGCAELYVASVAYADDL